jgi:hypothetical protein
MVQTTSENSPYRLSRGRGNARYYYYYYYYKENLYEINLELL